MNSLKTPTIFISGTVSEHSPERRHSQRSSDPRRYFRMNALELNADLELKSHSSLLDPANTHSSNDHWILTYPTLRQMVDSVCDEQHRRQGSACVSSSTERMAVIRQLGFSYARPPCGFWDEARFVARFTWACAMACIRRTST